MVGYGVPGAANSIRNSDPANSGGKMVVYGTLPADQYGLSRIAPGIWFVQGDEANRPENCTDPTIILLFGWMDAKTAHLAKFSVGYRKLYPYSSQLVVGSKADIFLLPKFLLKRRLQPAMVFLRSLGVVGSSPSAHRVLTHALSNGGTCQLNYLSQMMAQSPNKSGSKPLSSAVILDSTPGGDDLSSAIYVFSTTIPNPIFRYPFIAIIVIFHFLNFLLGRAPFHLHDIIRKAVLKPNWLPWINSKTPFLYIYSKTDRSVPYRQVQKHTEVAEKGGQDVTRLVFESSSHVSHMRSDPERYWSAIAAVWAKANAISD